MRTEKLTPEYGWDERLGRYRDLASGRLVSARDVRSALDGVIARTGDLVQDAASRLQVGQLTPAEFGEEVRRLLKDIHLAGSAAANGGWSQMTQADFGSVGYKLREEYAYLQHWVEQLERGEAPMDGRMLTRARLYVESARATYEEARRTDRALAGDNEERRVLHAQESCDDCVAYAEMGWQPIGSLPEIGDSQCQMNCRCTFDYRRVEPGEQLAD